MNQHKDNKTYSVLIIAIAIIYIAMGLRKLFGTESIVTDFLSWGYGPLFMKFIGAIELIGAVALLISRTRLYAIPSLGVVMLGAVGTHLMHAEYFPALLPVAMIVLLTIVFMMSQKNLKPVISMKGMKRCIDL